MLTTKVGRYSNQHLYQSINEVAHVPCPRLAWSTELVRQRGDQRSPGKVVDVMWWQEVCEKWWLVDSEGGVNADWFKTFGMIPKFEHMPHSHTRSGDEVTESKCSMWFEHVSRVVHAHAMRAHVDRELKLNHRDCGHRSDGLNINLKRTYMNGVALGQVT